MCACRASRMARNPRSSRKEKVCHSGAMNERRANAAAGVDESEGMGFRRLTQMEKRARKKYEE